jgi:hypothetical protein
MTAYLEDLWAWLKTAPLPVVIALNLVLGAWVYGIAGDAQIARADAAAAARQINRMDDKLDKLLEAVADLRAEQRYGQPALPPSPTPTASPRPRPYPGKEK